MDKIKRYSYVMKIVARLNIATIYITYVLFISVFFFAGIIFMFKTSFELNILPPKNFVVKLFVQHFFYTAFIVFCFFIISKKNIRLYKKAGILVVIYITISIVFSALMHLYVFSNMDRFDIQGFIKRNVYMWVYFYTLSWAYFHILKIHSKIKR